MNASVRERQQKDTRCGEKGETLCASFTAVEQLAALRFCMFASSLPFFSFLPQCPIFAAYAATSLYVSLFYLHCSVVICLLLFVPPSPIITPRDDNHCCQSTVVWGLGVFSSPFLSFFTYRQSADGTRWASVVDSPRNSVFAAV
jgi:hypothetical protein